MKKVKVKIPAKVNLTLDITGAEGGFHNLKTLVTSIDLFDEITVSARADGLVTLKTVGFIPECDEKSNNAYRAAELFVNTFSTSGVDITVKKNIPIASGLGGSSADIAGVLIAMQKLFNTRGDLGAIANKLGSDSGYMLSGGWAILEGKGDIVRKIPVKKRLYLLLITCPMVDALKVTAAACYKEYDRQGIAYPPSTENAVTLLLKGDEEHFLTLLKNDLYPSAKTVLPLLETNLNALKKHGAAVMTGSGATVIGVYKTAREQNNAYKSLRSIFGDKLIKAKTIKN